MSRGRPAYTGAIGLTAAVALAAWITREAWGSGPPSGIDTMAHLVRAEFAFGELFSQGRLDGWFPRFGLGYQEFMFYGPGLQWVMGITRLATFGVLSTEGALKVVMIGSFVLLPAAVAFFARSWGFSWVTGGLAALLSLTVSHSASLGIEAGFEIGLIPGQLGGALLFFALGALVRTYDGGRSAWLVVTAVSVALLTLIHPLSLLLFALVLPLLLLARSAAGGRSVRGLLLLSAAGLVSLGLVAFWWIPTMAHRDLAGTVVTFGTSPVAELFAGIWFHDLVFSLPFSFLTALAWAITVIGSFRSDRLRRLLPFVVIPAMYVVLGYWLQELARGELFIWQIASQLPNRGLGHMAVLALVPLAALLGDLGVRVRWYVGRWGVPLVVVITTAAVAASTAGLASVPRSADQAISQLREVSALLAAEVPNGARFATERDPGAEAHRLGVVTPQRWLAYHSGTNSLHLFTVESSHAWPASFAEEEFTRVPVEDSAESFRRSGVSHVVTTNESTALELVRSASYRAVYEEPPVAVFELVPAEGQPPPGSLLQTNQSPASATLLDVKPEHLRLVYEVEVATSGTIATAWSPKWTGAIDGSEVELQRGPDGLILVDLPAGRHELTLTYGEDGWDVAGRAVTIVTIGGLALWAGLVVARRRRATRA